MPREQSGESEKIEGEKEPVKKADPEEIREVLAAWDRALSEADVDGLAKLLAEEIVFLPHGRAPLESPKAVLDSYRALFAQYSVIRDSEIEEILIVGRWALVRAEESFVLEPAGGGDRLQTESRRILSVLRRGDDGRWRFARAMTNRGSESPGPASRNRLIR